MSDERTIRERFSKAGVPLERDDIWSVQSAKVVRHKALERLAAALHIEFKTPTILRAERDEAVLLVTGEIHLPAAESQTGSTYHASEWSIGEALVNVNYRVSGKQAAYVYAMAEKRAKDRVILKLADLHGVYSEDEADDFKAGNNSGKNDLPSAENDTSDSSELYTSMCLSAIAGFDTAEKLSAWWSSADNKRQRADMYGDGVSVDSIKKHDGYKRLLDAVNKKVAELRDGERRDAA